MGHIHLEIIVKSAEVFKNVNFFSKMHLYTTVCILGDDDSSSYKKKKTSVDEHSGSHPFWWFPMKFQVDESKLLKNNLMLLFQVKCSRNFGDKNVGILRLPIKYLYDFSGKKKIPNNVAYTINSRTSGRPHGVLYFSYMFFCENENRCIDQRQNYQSYQIRNCRNNNALLSAPLPCSSPTPSAPYIATEDDEYCFTSSPIDLSRNLPVNGYSVRSITPSAPYLQVEHGCSLRISRPSSACLQEEEL